MPGKRKLELEKWRRRIDAIDDKLLALLNQRASCSIEIGWIKRALNMNIYVPRREMQIFDRVSRANRGPLTGEAIRRLWERIIDESRSTERIVCSPPAERTESSGRSSRQDPSRAGRRQKARKNKRSERRRSGKRKKMGG